MASGARAAQGRSAIRDATPRPSARRGVHRGGFAEWPFGFPRAAPLPPPLEAGRPNRRALARAIPTDEGDRGPATASNCSNASRRRSWPGTFAADYAPHSGSIVEIGVAVDGNRPIAPLVQRSTSAGAGGDSVPLDMGRRRPFHQVGQNVTAPWPQHKVPVIRHEHVGEQAHRYPLEGVAEHPQEQVVVGWLLEQRRKEGGLFFSSLRLGLGVAR